MKKVIFAASVALSACFMACSEKEAEEAVDVQTYEQTLEVQDEVDEISNEIEELEKTTQELEDLGNELDNI